MDNTTKLFWLLRNDSLERELKYQEILKELIQNNKDRSKDFWNEDESEKTEYVLDKINEKITSLKEELADTPDLN